MFTLHRRGGGIMRYVAVEVVSNVTVMVSFFTIVSTIDTQVGVRWYVLCGIKMLGTRGRRWFSSLLNQSCVMSELASLSLG